MATIKRLLLFVFTLYLLPLAFSYGLYYFGDNNSRSWWELRRDSSQQAPPAAQYNGAIIQVYAARAARWRGAFGVHSWIAVKPTGQQWYTRIEVIGYQLRWRGESVSIKRGSADGYWFGSKPVLLREMRGGAEVDATITRLLAAAKHYPANQIYSVWPGPNSNTFIASMGRHAPELQLELPATAIGKDYLPNLQLIAPAPSGTGVQFSLKGLLGLLVAREEGIELNLLGFTAGIDFSPPAIKLPGVGRLGMHEYP